MNKLTETEAKNMQTRQKIQAVLDSSLTSSEIARAAAVSRQYVSQLRKGETSIDKISLGVAQRLQALYRRLPKSKRAGER